MDTQEKRIYIAILIGMLVLLALIIFFVRNIIRYHRQKLVSHLEKIRGEFNNLDKEKERIAIELHDDLGGSLSAVKLQMQSLRLLDAEDLATVENAEARIDEIMVKLRSYAFNLMPGILQRKGLDEALKDLIDLITHATNIKIVYQFNIPVCNKETTIHIYRIIQEILNNIIKHAKASMIKLSLAKNKNKIQLHVSDNGIGFNKDDISLTKNGLGLHNITSRADLLNAKVFLNAAPGRGVDYLIEIPAL